MLIEATAEPVTDFVIGIQLAKTSALPNVTSIVVFCTDNAFVDTDTLPALIDLAE